jgi:hypothetical protein
MNEFTRKAMELAVAYAKAFAKSEQAGEVSAVQAEFAARSALLAHLEGAEEKAIERCPCGYPMPCNVKVPITFCKQAPATPTEEQPQ